MLTLNGSYGNRQKYKTPNRPRGNFNEKENRMKYSLIIIFLIILQSCCSLNVKEVSHSQLVYPLVTQTAPPSLYYYGTHEGYDYFSILFTKYKVLGSNMNDQFRFDFTSWNKTHRMEMHVHMLELIPQTIYESEVYHKNSRPVLEAVSYTHLTLPTT